MEKFIVLFIVPKPKVDQLWKGRRDSVLQVDDWMLFVSMLLYLIIKYILCNTLSFFI